MPWQSLQQRLSALPLVLCGPIVRRATENGVSVWIALKEPKSVVLDVLDSPATGAGTVVSGQANTIALGARLHVALVVIEQQGVLQPDRIYGYNMRFDNQSFDDAGVLAADATAGLDRIRYSDHYPSFLLPATDLTKLSIAHGSCRKAHGGYTDPASGLSRVLGERAQNKDTRPQQLYLTGDQIYADDVTDCLLHMCIDMLDPLLGWRDNPPGVTDAELRPHDRGKIVTNDVALSGGAKVMKSHLIRLGEYYGMYLLTWSDVLWDTDLPTFEQVFPDIEQMQTVMINGVPTQRPHPRVKCYHEEIEKVERFRKSVPQVRRLLANIATYMVFDDHEITDDWFLYREWCTDAMKKKGDGTSTVARRTIANGLVAFGLFQGWGNDWLSFDSGKKKELLQKIPDVNTAGSNDTAREAALTALENIVLPNVIGQTDAESRLDSEIRWDFTIDFPAYRLHALDTRTRRGFGGKKKPPALIHSSDLDNQLPASIAAPQNPQHQHKFRLVISGAPIIGHPTMEEIVQPILAGIKGPEFADTEAWLFDEKIFQELLRRLSKQSPVVILSGDVHYAFTATLRYWNDRTNDVNTGVAVQLCSSAMSNADRLTRMLSTFVDPGQGTYFGWTPGVGPDPVYWKDFDGDLDLVPVDPGDPPTTRVDRHDRYDSGKPPNWQYTVTFEKDNRNGVDRGRDPVTHTGDPMDDDDDWNKYRQVLGRDNFGIIAFDNAANPKLTHQLWWSQHKEDVQAADYRAYTLHTVELAPPSAQDKPGQVKQP